jgi:hypothetical protein
MVMAYDGTVASASKEKLPLWAEIFLSQRQFLGLTQTEVSNLTFNGFENVVSQVTVSDVETGKVNPLTLRSERLFALLNALKFDGHLWAKTGLGFLPVAVSLESDPDYAPVRTLYIPEVDAGAGLPNWDDDRRLVKTFLPRDRSYDRLSEKDLFRVRIRGDSMYPTFQKGQSVVFRVATTAEPGHVVVVHLPEDGLNVKRLRQIIANPNDTDRPFLVLASDNPAYPVDLAPEGSVIRGVKVFAMTDGPF